MHSVVERLQFVKIHEQRCPLKGVEILIDELLLYRPFRRIRSSALAPIAEDRNINRIEMRMAVMKEAGTGNQFAPSLYIERVAGFGRPDSSVFVIGFVRTSRAGAQLPGRQRVLLVVRHDADGEGLMMPSCLVKREIDDLPAVFTPPRLDLRPGPAHVSDRGLGEIRLRGSLPLSGQASDQFRPRLMASPLKRWKVVMPMPGLIRTS